MIQPSKEFWTKFKSVSGALSCTEALSIIQLAALAPRGVAIELGTNKGKSSMSALQSLNFDVFYLIEPEFKNENWEDETIGNVSFNIFSTDNIIVPLADYSYNVIDKYAPYSYVFWDSGEHAGEVLIRERDMLRNAMVSGGILVSHDIGNQFTQQKEAMDFLVSTGDFEWIPIDWDGIRDYIRQNVLEEGNNSWHLYDDNPFPNFVGAIRRK